MVALAFWFFTLIMVVALAASEGAQPTTSGKIEAAVIFGFFILFFAGCLIRVYWIRRRIEVGRDAIVSRRGPRGKPFTLTRDDADTLRILPQFTLYNRTRAPRLVFLGSRGGYMLLAGFSVKKVGRVCTAQGWRFDGDPALAVRDVQTWLHRGQSVEAVQLLQLFGPFPEAATDDEPGTGLAAAVFEDVGDKFASSARTSARDAYQRAASAQQVFAGYARSSQENAARLAEANRMTAKAQN